MLLSNVTYPNAPVISDWTIKIGNSSGTSADLTKTTLGPLTDKEPDNGYSLRATLLRGKCLQ